MRILLADDSIDHQLLVRSYMKQTTHHMEVVDSGQLAVEAFKARQFELVLIKSQLPVLDGHAAVRAMRAWERQAGSAPIPIVTFIGRDLEEAEAALRAGASATLARPVQQVALFDCLSTLRWPDPSVVWSGRGGEDRSKRIAIKIDPALKELIPGFLAKRAEDLKELKAALKKQDFECIRLVAHRLKGKGTGYGFAGISKIGDALEHAARARDVFGLREGIEELSSYLGRIDLEY